jgi:hypothetical protein
MVSAFNTSQALSQIARSARPLSFINQVEYDSLLAVIGDARIVLIGEASRGTHDFYRERARITRQLIEEKGLNAVAVEGDWPDAYRVNRFVTCQDGGTVQTRPSRRSADFAASRRGCGGTWTCLHLWSATINVALLRSDSLVSICTAFIRPPKRCFASSTDMTPRQRHGNGFDMRASISFPMTHRLTDTLQVSN